jgi:hypothetical protein
MKLNHHARRILKRRIWAGRLAILLLALAEFWMVCRFGHDYGQITAQAGLEAPALGDWLAAR